MNTRHDTLRPEHPTRDVRPPRREQRDLDEDGGRVSEGAERMGTDVRQPPKHRLGSELAHSAQMKQI